MPVIEAALLGLSTGIYCLGYCLPVMFPLFMGEEQPSFIKRIYLLLKFSGGRLIAYLLFGAVIGYAGGKISDPVVQKTFALSMIVLSILLVVYGLGKTPTVKLCLLNRVFARIKLPVIFGFLTGFNICPPFLLALSHVSAFAELYKAVYFFLIFFVVTNLYLVPIVFAGYFSIYKEMRWIARTSAIISGVLFLLIGLSKYFIACKVVAN